MKEILSSRQFIAALVGLLVVFFGERAGLSGEDVTNAVTVVVSYILGRGLQVGLAGR